MFMVTNKGVNKHFRELSPCDDETLEVEVSVGSGGLWCFRVYVTIDGIKQGIHMSRDTFRRLTSEMVKLL